MRITVYFINGKSTTFDNVIRKAGMDQGLLKIWTEDGQVHSINMMHVAQVTLPGNAQADEDDGDL